MRSILIVKTSAIGDVIQTFPVLDYLKSRFPDAEIDWVVEKPCASLLAAHPHLTRVIPLDSKAWRKGKQGVWKEIASFYRTLRAKHYDCLFDLQGNSKSGLITLLAKARQKIGYAWNSLPEKPNWIAMRTRYKIPLHLSVRERYLHLVQRHFEDETPFKSQGVRLALTPEEQSRFIQPHSPSLMVAFGSNWKNKRLKKETLTAFLHLIDQEIHPHFIFIWGNEEERKQAEELKIDFPKSQTLGNLTLPLWQAYMYSVDAVLAMDSAALHLSATTSTPSFSLFGPSSARYYTPDNHTSLQGPCPYNRTFHKRCPILRTCPSGACMDFNPQHLATHFLSFWRSQVFG